MKRNSWVRIGSGVLLCVGGAVLGGIACDRVAPRGGMSQAVPAQAIQIQLGAEPISLDPSLAEDGVSLQVLANVMEGLVCFDGAGKLGDCLAASHRVSGDGLRYTFELRPEANWSDGVPVRAAEFVAGIRRTLDPSTASKMAYFLFPIRNAERFHLGQTKAEDVGVRAEGNRVIVELDHPSSSFLQVMALQVALPVRAAVLAENGGKWNELGPSTGAYSIGFRKPGELLLLEPNPAYWAKTLGITREYPPAAFRIVPEESTALALFDTGKLDITTRIPSLDLERLKKQGVLHVDPFLATYYLGFNVRKAPFNQTSWRRAVSSSISRPEITAILDGGERPARTWIPPGLEGYVPEEGNSSVSRIPRMDRDAIAEVKHELSTHAAPEVTAGFDSGERNSLILEKVQEDLRKNLGLEIRLDSQDWKTYIGRLSTDAPQIYRLGWLTPILDPLPHLEAFMSHSPNNYTGWGNAQYDALVVEVRRLLPGRVREAKIREAQAILVEREAVVVPIYHYSQTHAVSPRVQGFRVNPFGVVRLSELRLTPGP